MELEESGSLAPDYTTKLQSSKQSGTGKKTRNVDQQNRIEGPEINPCAYGQLVYNKRSKDIQWGKDSLFSKSIWENWTATCKRTKLDYFL